MLADLSLVNEEICPGKKLLQSGFQNHIPPKPYCICFKGFGLSHLHARGGVIGFDFYFCFLPPYLSVVEYLFIEEQKSCDTLRLTVKDK